MDDETYEAILEKSKRKKNKVREMIGEPFYRILCQEKYQNMFEYLPRYYSNIIEEYKTEEDKKRVVADYDIQKMQEKVLLFVNRIYMND